MIFPRSTVGNVQVTPPYYNTRCRRRLNRYVRIEGPGYQHLNQHISQHFFVSGDTNVRGNPVHCIPSSEHAEGGRGGDPTKR